VIPEARFHRVSNQLLRVFRLLAVALCATAFVLPAANAAARKASAAKTKKVMQVESKRKSVASEAAGKSKNAIGNGRRVFASFHQKNGRAVARIVQPRLSFGQLAGLHNTEDVLDLKSGVALVIDQDTQQVLFRKNERAVLPIASLTKLMTGLLVSEAKLPLDQPITITQDDVDTEKGSRSRLTVGATLPRGELLHLALMASENRAAHALGRTYPGGLANFVSLMNAKARMLGMKNTHYVEPTGLSSSNRSSAQDLARLVDAASADPVVRQLSTSPEYAVEVGNRVLQYNTTNRLVKDPEWTIGVQKTGYISEAGQCLVMQTRIAGRTLIMVFLDATGKFSRIGDAERVRRWVEANHVAA
jgi:D-alanyl-D-alanine endopeptidase (penicillin-binding protein 7)